MSFLVEFLYQPFLNILVLFYWVLGHTRIGYDMGVAVILLTIFIRILLLPLTLMSQQSEKERRSIEAKILEIKSVFADDPVRRRKEERRVMRSKPQVLFAETLMFLVQVIIFFILYRIFSTGLEGEDLHLLYSWMPQVPQPFNLLFLGKFDLAHPDFVLNLTQSILIFLMEAIGLLTSPFPTTRSEVVKVQFTLPIVSFIVFAFLPAGKKLFVITTLSFSIIVMLVRYGYHLYAKYFPEPEEEEKKPEQYIIVPESVMDQLKNPAEKPEEHSHS